MTPPPIIIGSRPYQHLNLNPIIDAFAYNFRCNIALPGHNNGSRYDQLGACCHVIEHLLDFSPERFRQEYSSEVAPAYLEEFIRRFPKERELFSKIFFVQPQDAIVNAYLAKFGLHLSKQPRTGFSLALEQVMAGQPVWLIRFSIQQEPRRAFYSLRDEDSPWHSGVEEIKILRALHERGLLDASLCLLKDCEVPTFSEDSIKPTSAAKDLVHEVFHLHQS